MADYTFRGKPITGPKAIRILKAWQLIQEYAPSPNEIFTLMDIANDWEKLFEEGLRAQREEFDKNPPEEED